MYFSGFGWLQFDPTPSGGDGTAQARPYQTKPAGSGAGPAPVSSTGPSVGARPSTGPGGQRLQHPVPQGAGPVAAQPAKSSGTPWGAVALAVIAAIALACGVIAIVGAAGAPRAVLPRRRGPAPSAGDPDHGGPGGGRGRGRRPRPVPAAVRYSRDRPAGRLGDGRHRVRRGLRGHAGGAGDQPDRAAAVALDGAAKDDASRAHAAWREFRDDLADFGVGARPSEPPRTLAERVTARAAEQAGDGDPQARAGRGAGQLRGAPVERRPEPAAGRRRGQARARGHGPARRALARPDLPGSRC